MVREVLDEVNKNAGAGLVPSLDPCAPAYLNRTLIRPQLDLSTGSGPVQPTSKAPIKPQSKPLGWFPGKHGD
jgi:hypothetical protein